MVKHGFNARWLERDAVYNNLLKAFLKVLFLLAVALGGLYKKRGSFG